MSLPTDPTGHAGAAAGAGGGAGAGGASAGGGASKGLMGYAKKGLGYLKKPGFGGPLLLFSLILMADDMLDQMQQGKDADYFATFQQTQLMRQMSEVMQRRGFESAVRDPLKSAEAAAAPSKFKPNPHESQLQAILAGKEQELARMAATGGPSLRALLAEQ